MKNGIAYTNHTKHTTPPRCVFLSTSLTNNYFVIKIINYLLSGHFGRIKIKSIVQDEKRATGGGNIGKIGNGWMARRSEERSAGIGRAVTIERTEKQRKPDPDLGTKGTVGESRHIGAYAPAA